MKKTASRGGMKATLSAFFMAVAASAHAHDPGPNDGFEVSPRFSAKAGEVYDRSPTLLGSGGPAKESADEDKDYDGPTRLALSAVRFQPATRGMHLGDAPRGP